MQYTGLISQNCAPAQVSRIGLYDAAGRLVGRMPVGRLANPARESRLYSFGLLSDIHLPVETAEEDFRRALAWLADQVDFVTVCGDLTQDGTAEQLGAYKAIVDSCPIPVYAIPGNHDVWTLGPETLEANISAYTGHPLYYAIDHGGDTIIMLGVRGDSEGTLFTAAELQWLRETLEANRDRRCILCTHVRPQDACGNAWGIYSYDIWGGQEAEVFEGLLRQYPNVILFHGHSHLSLTLQTRDNLANYDQVFGLHSVHVPSITVPRTGDVTGANSLRELYAESQGFVVDVYRGGLHLMGRDFAADAYIAAASYWLPTPSGIQEGV